MTFFNQVVNEDSKAFMDDAAATNNKSEGLIFNDEDKMNVLSHSMSKIDRDLHLVSEDIHYFT